MLKKVFINSKKIPVPVPVRTLFEAVSWIEAALVPPGHTITRVALNDKLVSDLYGVGTDDQDINLDDASRLEIQIDSPMELTVQALEAMRNLSSVVMGGLKMLAYQCWKAKPGSRITELESVSNDMSLVLDLIDHVSGLIGPMDMEVAPVQGIGGVLRQIAVSLAMAKANNDLKASAKLLLNRLEPLLKDLIDESENLQLRLYTHSGLALVENSGRR